MSNSNVTKDQAEVNAELVRALRERDATLARVTAERDAAHTVTGVLIGALSRIASSGPDPLTPREIAIGVLHHIRTLAGTETGGHDA